MINPSSKITLKMSCLASCRGNVDEAEKLYRFLADGVELPDFDLPRQSVFEQIKQVAADAFSWVKENKDDIASTWEMLRGMRGSGGEPAAAELPPLPKGGTSC